MSSVVLDFFHNEKEKSKYLLRLRGTSNGIIDLAGNNVINHNVDYTSTPSTLGEGTALKFNGTNAWLETSMQEDLGFTDYTISLWVLNVQHWAENDSYRNCIFVSKDPSTYFFIIFNGKHTSDQGYYSIGYGCTDEQGKYYSTYFQLGSSSYPSMPFHIAIVKHDSLVKMYHNGNQITNYFELGNPLNELGDAKIYPKGSDMYIGYMSQSSSPNKYLMATLDDLCIIQGKALWTQNFTPPTTYLPDKI